MPTLICGKAEKYIENLWGSMVGNLACNDNTLAIYDYPGSFSDRWIELCRQRSIPYVTVDLLDDDLFRKLWQANVAAFLCHPTTTDRRSSLTARSIILSLALTSLRVFPKPEDYWHYEDKIAQKYIFDAAGIPTPATHIFFSHRDALVWAKSAEFPCVLKLTAGCDSLGVLLIRNRKEATAWISRMFARGDGPLNNGLRAIARKIRSHRVSRASLGITMRSPGTMWHLLRRHRDGTRERGYVYLQELLDGNSYCTRVVVIGNRAFAYRMMVTPGEFRSYSGDICDYDPTGVDLACVQEAFEAAKRIGTSCMGFDLIRQSSDGTPMIVEMSIKFSPERVFKCPGYWLTDMSWQDGHIWPQDAILDDLLSTLNYQRDKKS